MKKLGFALLAAALSLPVFAAQTPSTTSNQPATQTAPAKKANKKHARNTNKNTKKMHKKSTAPSNSAAPKTQANPSPSK